LVSKVDHPPRVVRDTTTSHGPVGSPGDRPARADCVIVASAGRQRWTRAQLEEGLTRDHDQILALVQDLVRIPSENPPGDTTRVFAYVVDYLARRGLDHEGRPIRDSRRHFRREGGNACPT
jgi:hypothetical protein